MKTLRMATCAAAIIALVTVFGSPVLADGYLGVYPQTIDEDLQEAFNLDVDYGVVIRSVVDDSPAEEAGLKKGDILLKFNNRKLRDADDLYKYVDRADSGDDVELLVIREGKEKEIAVTLGIRDDFEDKKEIFIKKGRAPKSYTKAFQFYHDELADTYIGVTLENLNDQLGSYFGVEDGEGALITEVLEDSPAEKAGIKAGDVIVSVGGEDIEELSDVQETVGDADEGDELKFTIIRDKSKMDVAITVDEAPESYSKLKSFSIPGCDDFHFFAPKMKGITRGNFLFDDDIDIDHDFEIDEGELEELEESLESMQKELKELQKHIKEIDKKLD